MKILFARHGEALHNVALETREFAPREILELFACGLRDPPLTERGRRQAQLLGATLCALPRKQRPTLIVASTQLRALQTALIATKGLRGGDGAGDDPPRVIALEALRERHGRWLCEQRRDRADLLRSGELDAARLDLSRVAERDPLWQPLAMESRGSAATRAAAAVRWLAARHEHEVVLVVSHGGFLRSSIFGGGRGDGALALRDARRGRNSSSRDGAPLETLLRRTVQNCELRAVRLFAPDTADGSSRPAAAAAAAELLGVVLHTLLPGECEADFAAREELAMRNMMRMHQLSRDELRAELVRLRGGAARL